MDSLEALAHELRTSGASLKLVSLDQVHLTLKFLGDVEEGLVPEIASAIREACEGVPPFVVRMKGTGAFPSLSRMNVLWVGVEGAEPLVRIAGFLNEHLATLGFEAERRPWSAHVTLARVKGGRPLDRVRLILTAHQDSLFGETRVEEVRLKRSVLGPSGPTYSTVEAVSLSADVPD